MCNAYDNRDHWSVGPGSLVDGTWGQHLSLCSCSLFSILSLPGSPIYIGSRDIGSSGGSSRVVASGLDPVGQVGPGGCDTCDGVRR